ncbi:transport permease protein [Planotetraspora thailandica]|uniref:Transport permease protein n=1 Tax=Planotetraspora thailandica TaxID=487172 RepID=A0A8J3Y079_9ACTN|nr:ABC transporter permease [Planotetraspora thailandica]GII58433.1 transport permease protein [Planotetraspora thailandica]
MSALLVDTWWMTHRRLKAQLRQPGLVVMTLVQPAIWLFLFGGLFRKVAELPGFGAASYVDYLVPGVVVMSAVSSSMWSGMGVIEEIERGTLNRFLVSPVRRSAILNAGVVEQAVTTAIQSVVIVGLGRLAGASYPGGFVGVAVLVVASVLLGAVFSALSNTMGLLVRQRETIIGLSVALLLPLTFLSTAFMAPALMPDWIKAVASFNPLNWSLDTARAALTADPDWSVVAVHGGWLLALAAVMIATSTLSFRSYQKSV